MLSSLAAVPQGMANFVTNRRRTFTWLAGSVGGAYLLGQWGLRKVGEVAERSRRDNLDKDNLARRFNLNQQDCQFTVLALLPTVSAQILQEMDVEGCSAQLSAAAAREKAARQRELDEQREAEERQQREEQERVEAARLQAEREAEVERTRLTEEADRQRLAAEAQQQSGAEEQPAGQANGHALPPDAPQHTLESTTDSPTATAMPKVAATTEGEPTAATSEEIQTPEAFAEANHGSAPPGEDPALSKSWSEVVVNGDGQAGTESMATLPPQLESASTAVSDAVPERSRAELWTDIKILSFTRTITSIYILTLLALQTHVQLNLLGRASYVTSVLSNLPASSSSSDLSMKNDQDLEMALYAEKLADQQVGVSKDTERKYLTFSWWLLHRGWKIVAERVQQAVEEIVGPMGLKATLVYGETSTLFSQIRQKVECNADGTLFDFSSALFPPTRDDELETLSSGGISVDSLGAMPVTAELRRLLNETSDCLDAPDCTLVRKLCLDRLFTHLVLSLETPFRPALDAGPSAQGSRFEDVTERTTRLASLLPTVARQSHVILNSMPNEYVQALEDVRELTEFSAIIYSSFDRDNVRGSC